MGFVKNFFRHVMGKPENLIKPAVKLFENPQAPMPKQETQTTSENRKRRRGKSALTISRNGLNTGGKFGGGLNV